MQCDLCFATREIKTGFENINGWTHCTRITYTNCSKNEQTIEGYTTDCGYEEGEVIGYSIDY